jgi:Flp pilus assembly protein TadD
MSRKHKPIVSKQALQASGLNAKLRRAAQLIDEDELEAAEQLLLPLRVQAPNNIEVWRLLFEIYAEMRHSTGLWETSYALVQIAPQVAEHVGNVVTTALSNGLFFNAHHFMKHYLAHFPNEVQAEAMRKALPDLERTIAEIKVSGDMAPGLTAEDAMATEVVTMCFARGNVAEAERLSRLHIQRSPNLAAPRNNLGMCLAMQGHFEAAIAVMRETLDMHPDNLHTAANLCEFLYRNGQAEEARALLSRIDIPALPPETVLKQLEVYSMLDENALAVSAFERFRGRQPLAQLSFSPNGFHLVAAAYARLGNDGDAKTLWNHALKLDPDFSAAIENLDNLRRPVGERMAAFALSMDYWVPQVWETELVQIGTAAQHSNALLRTTTNAWYESHPALAVALPILWERSDEAGRNFALYVASVAQLPVLKDWALGEHGTDQDRLRALNGAVAAGFLPRSEPAEMLVQGRRQPILGMAYDVYFEADLTDIPKERLSLNEKIHAAIHAKNYARGETLARQAVAKFPEAPSSWNFLTAALQQQKKDEEAKAVLNETLERFPDYFFAKGDMVRLLIRENRLEEAEAWLVPLRKVERLHVSEFKLLCIANIEYAVAKREAYATQSWLAVMENILGDEDPLIRDMRGYILSKSNLFRNLNWMR